MVVVSFIGGGNRSNPVKTTDLSQVTDKLYRIRILITPLVSLNSSLYRVHLAINIVRTRAYNNSSDM